MRFRPITSRLTNESGQAAIEFALILPLLVMFVFLIADFGRLFNAYNDLNQMAADGARFAAVGNFPGASALVDKNADTNATRSATICGPTYGSATICSSGTCTVGTTVRVKASATISFIPLLKIADIPLEGKSEMRVERCPTP
jgi:Flp pilus assembly protein TadG